MLIGLAALSAMCVAFLLVRHFHFHLPESHRSDESSAAVRIGLTVVSSLSGLVLGLVLTSMKTNFDAVQRDVRLFGSQLITLDNTLREVGEEAGPIRHHLLQYTQAALDGSWPTGNQAIIVDDQSAAKQLRLVERMIVAFKSPDLVTTYYNGRALRVIESLIALRSTIVSENRAFLPPVFLIMLIAWFTFLFGSFGYRAPRNATVTISCLCAAFAVASAVGLMTELDGAFTGLVRVSGQPLQHAVAVLSRD